MHNNSLLSTIRGKIATSMNAQISAQSLYSNTTMNSNVGFNTQERKARLLRSSQCIICGESRCGSNESPESGRCI